MADRPDLDDAALAEAERIATALLAETRGKVISAAASRLLASALATTRAEMHDLLALHNVPDVAALNVYIGSLEQEAQERAALASAEPERGEIAAERAAWL